MKAPLLLGAALLACVLFALFGASVEHTPSQVGAWSAVGLAASLAIGFGWPRLRRISLKRGDTVVRVSGRGEPIPVADAHLHLAAISREGAAGPRDYGVVLEGTSGARFVLLSDPNPDRVLSDLALVRGVVPLALSPGWGLPADSPWTEPSSGPEQRVGPESVAASSSLLEPKSGRTKTSIAGTILVGSVGICIFIVRDVWVRLSLGDTPSLLSIVLPILFLSLLVAIGLGILTSRVALELDTELRFSRMVYGRPIEQRSIARSAIRAGFLVSPEGAGDSRHLLLDTVNGPMSFPCDAAVGERVLAGLHGGGPEISSAPPVQSRE